MILTIVTSAVTSAMYKDLRGESAVKRGIGENADESRPVMLDIFSSAR